MWTDLYLSSALQVSAWHGHGGDQHGNTAQQEDGTQQREHPSQQYESSSAMEITK